MGIDQSGESRVRQLRLADLVPTLGFQEDIAGRLASAGEILLDLLARRFHAQLALDAAQRQDESVGRIRKALLDAAPDRQAVIRTMRRLQAAGHQHLEQFGVRIAPHVLQQPGHGIERIVGGHMALHERARLVFDLAGRRLFLHGADQHFLQLGRRGGQDGRGRPHRRPFLPAQSR